MKVVEFLGSALEELRSFPTDARREAGFQIERLQRGFEPDSWKPMKSIGQGVHEIRVRQVNGAYRVIYIATFGEAIYILHAFQKKTQATPKREIDLAATRYKSLVKARNTDWD
jgi:phage-related protein